MGRCRRSDEEFAPDSGAVRIPEACGSEPRLASAGRCRGGRETRSSRDGTPVSTSASRAQFCYVDAYTEPEPTGPNWPPPGGPETREAYLERLRATPTHLCRLRYFGDEERWGFAFYTYSNERYELSVFPSGEFLGPPEDAFRVAAGVYLS
jgi:hypothetical protein